MDAQELRERRSWVQHVGVRELEKGYEEYGFPAVGPMDQVQDPLDEVDQQRQVMTVRRSGNHSFLMLGFLSDRGYAGGEPGGRHREVGESSSAGARTRRRS